MLEVCLHTGWTLDQYMRGNPKWFRESMLTLIVEKNKAESKGVNGK